jgi:hypothetical protein
MSGVIANPTTGRKQQVSPGNACENVVMATVIRDFKDLPEVTAPVPGRKPPVLSFPYQESERPDEADEFLAYIRKLRRSSPSAPPPDPH